MVRALAGGEEGAAVDDAVNRKRGGAESTAARDRACWSKWWAPTIGPMLPHVVTQRDIGEVIDAMEREGLAPLTINTHWGVVKAFFGWLADEDVLAVSPIASTSMTVDHALDRVREIVVPLPPNCRSPV